MAEDCQFEIFQDRADEYRWRLRAANGQIIATSGEGYTSKDGCEGGMRAVVSCLQGRTPVEDQT